MSAAVAIAYLVAASLFVLGLKRQQRVRTAESGNLLSALGMLVSVVATLVAIGKVNWPMVIGGMALGGLIGLVSAQKVPMTAMPQMVAVFNGFGGGASALVALVQSHLATASDHGDAVARLTTLLGADAAVTVVLSVIIGGVTFSGSMVAFAKLQDLIRSDPILLPARHVILVLVGLVTLAAGALLAGLELGVSQMDLLGFVLLGLSLVLGVLLVIPIGGADMPVVISLLNSYSGLAAAMTGFVLHNNLLIITGALVGASGLILTNIMCKAMNRSLANVMFGGFGAESAKKSGADEYTNIKSTTPDEAAIILENASSVVFVPGYGLAVAQAQHALAELGKLLKSKGISVKYAIHPVAGRMPGHMNVLLAEANVPYEELVEMDQINPEFKNTDVVVVVGANDVVNPAANDEPGSPIYGMPILNVHEAKTVIVIKRSLSPGFAKIPNKLFDAPNTLMLFSDAKNALTQIVDEFKQL